MKPRPPRQPVDRAASLHLAGCEDVPARIKDISEGGARLIIPGSWWVPDGFDLRDVFAGVTRKVRVVWRGQEGTGVRFLDEAGSPSHHPAGFGRRQPRV